MREGTRTRRLVVPNSSSDDESRMGPRLRTRGQEKKQNEMASLPEEEAPSAAQASQTPLDMNNANFETEDAIGDKLQSQAIPQGRRPWSIERMRAIISYHIADLRQDHGYFVRAWLRNSRLASLHQSASSDRSSGAPIRSPLKAENVVDDTSPFADMKGKEAGSTSKSPQTPGSPGRLIQEVVRGPNAKNDKRSISVPITSYAANPLTVPTYTSYITLRSNILTEDDEQMRYWPYFGESEVENVESHKAISELFSNRIKDMPMLHLRAEQAANFGDCCKRFLADVGCSVTDVLHFLLDKEKPIPDELVPLDWEAVWNDREDHLEENYNQDDEKEMKRWREVQRKLPPSSPTSIAVAGLACKAFLDATGFSIWHIAKKENLVTDIESPRKTAFNTPITKSQARQARESDPYTLGTYADLGCLVCFAHECPGHGAFADDDDDDDDAEEVEEAALSPRSRTHALFPRIAKISELLEGGTEELFASHLSAETLHNESGLDDNGEIWGDPPIPVEENEDDLLADDELCSPFCFWKKSNRSSSNLSGWSESELALLDALLPAYVTSKRCACLLAHSLSKRCIDVYFRVRSKINANGLSTAAKLLQSDRIRSRLTNKRGFEHWLENSKTWKHHERGAFKPCNHVGSCEKRGCPCYEAGITCEKACMCSDGCTRRFRGCSCARGNRPCWKNKRCDCYKLNRECDPDLCGTCGAAEALDPVNRYDERARLHCCSNMHIQKNVPKRTLLGHSAVAGWGLYMGEPAKAGDYLGEYKGEVISKDESERRGWVYDNRNISYLFDLNMNQVLDSTRAGNKFRYVNHQDKPDVNCEPRVLFCNMAHRIGMYATRDIQVGEELLFDYGYSGEAVKFVKVKLRKNSNNTGDSSRDASGTNKGSTSRIILTVKKPGKRGGARAGAGRKPRALKAAAAAKAKLAASATATSGTVASSSSPSSLKLVSQYSAKPKQKHAITPSSTSPSLLVSPSSSSSAAVAATLAAAPAGASAGTHSNKITTLRVHGPSSRDSSSTITSMKRKRGSAAMPSGLHGLMMDGSADAIPIIEIEDDDDDDEDGEDEEEDSEDDEDEEDEGEEEDGRGRRAGDEEGEEVEVEMIGEEDEDYHNSANEEESEASSSAVSASAPIMKSSRFRRSQRWKKRRVG